MQTRAQRARLRERELVQHNLRAVRAMLLREDFQRFWEYRDHFGTHTRCI